MKALEVQAAKRGSVVGDDDEREQFASLSVQAVFEQARAHECLGSRDRLFEREHRVSSVHRAGHGSREHRLGGVVDDRADPPRAVSSRGELGEVGLPHTIASCRGDEECVAPGGRELPALLQIAGGKQQTSALERPRHARRGDLHSVGAQHRPDLAVAPW
jgi:hypothetical protein